MVMVAAGAQFSSTARFTFDRLGKQFNAINKQVAELRKVPRTMVLCLMRLMCTQTACAPHHILVLCSLRPVQAPHPFCTAHNNN